MKEFIFHLGSDRMHATFLPPGTYTVAVTCQATLDNPDQADSAVIFNPVKTGISVDASQTTTVDIP
jgi:hypothetical protein